MIEEYSAFPDELLVMEIQAGSLLAFQALVQRYQTRLQFYARRIVWDDSAAEDVVQETFMKVYQAIHRIDLEQRFSTYLFTIAKNTAISVLRAQRPAAPIDQAELQSSSEDLNVTVDNLVRSERINQALQKMDQRYRTMIELYYFEHLSYEEIQTRTGLPLNTVRTHLRRAKAALRRHLTHDT